MDPRLEKIISECTLPLSDDRELSLDVAQELRSHLLEKCEELNREGLSEAEAVDAAVKDFGDSAEISESLYRANLPRFKFRAKLRLALKLLFFPLFIFSLYWALDFRLLEGVSVLCEGVLMHDVGKAQSDPLYVLSRKMASFRSFSSHAPADRIMRRILKKRRKLTADEALILSAERIVTGTEEEPSRKIAWQKAICQRFPDNKAYLANYVQHLLAYSEADDIIAEIINARSIDPENAAYDYILCAVLLKQALQAAQKWEKSDPPEKFYLLRDRERLDWAMQELRNGMRKPFFRLYTLEMFHERMKILQLPQDYVGQLQRLVFSAEILLPILNVERNILRATTFYAELLQKEGKSDDAEFYLDAWKHIVPQFNDDSFTLIAQMVIGSGLNEQYKSALYRNDMRRAQELKTAAEPMNSWRAKSSEWETDPLLRKSTGFLSSILFRPLKGGVLAPEQLAPERNLTYTLMDTAALSLQASLIMIFLLGNAAMLFFLYLRGQRPFLILPPWRTMLRVLLLGLVLPLGLYLLYSRVDFLGGHNYNIAYNMPRFLIGIIFFILIPPRLFVGLYWQALKRRGQELGYRRLPLATCLLNLLVAGLAALFLISGGMRPIIAYEQKHYVETDKLIFNGEYFSPAEERLIKEINKRQRAALQEAMRIK